MNPNLKKAAAKYKTKIVDINSISSLDAEIINEILIAFSKLEQTELCEILNEYKKKKDKDILYKLLEWNTNFRKVEEIDKNGHKKTFRNFVDIGEGEFLIDVYKLKAICKNEEYNTIHHRMEYLLEIHLFAQNNDDIYNIPYSSKKKRDVDLKEIRKKLLGCGIKIL